MKKFFAVCAVVLLALGLGALALMDATPLADPPGIEWSKCLGGSDFDDAQSIWQTADGGYVTAGCTNSDDGDVNGGHGNDDFWVVKLALDSK